MQRRSRLTGSRRFSQIHQQGASTANRFLVIRFLANGLDQSRFGFAISKRIGNAVVRNKLKRRLREVMRMSRVRAGWDAVFIARKGSAGASYRELRQAADGLLRHSKLIEAEDSALQSGPKTGAGTSAQK